MIFPEVSKSLEYLMMIMARTRVFDILDDFNNFAYNLSDYNIIILSHELTHFCTDIFL